MTKHKDNPSGSPQQKGPYYTIIIIVEI